MKRILFAVRLSSMGGVVAFKGFMSGRETTLQIVLTEDGDNLTRALLY